MSARKYETKVGSVVVKTYEMDNGMVKMSAILVRHDKKVDVTRCEVSIGKSTDEYYKVVRRTLVDAVISKFDNGIEKGYIERDFTTEEVCVGVIDIVKNHLFAGIKQRLA